MAELTYNGIDTVPGDYECADGQLAASINLVYENGALQPLFAPSVIFSLPAGYKVLYIHTTTAYTHYIVCHEDNSTSEGIYWIDAADAHGDRTALDEEKSDGSPYYHALTAPEGETITGIQGIGNTLVLITDAAMNYYLWKTYEEEPSEYLYLGTHLPELNLSFGLLGEMVHGDKVDVTLPEKPDEGDDDYESKLESYKSTITERVMAVVNPFIADNSTNAGRFLFPFFVRYAYRLYDGSLTMHSAPILMTTMSCPAPLVSSSVKDEDKREYTIYARSVICDIDYMVENSAMARALSDWEDIITSVDVFVSAPIWTIDQSGRMEAWQTKSYSRAYSVCKFTNPDDEKLSTTNPISVKTEYSFDKYYQYNLVAHMEAAAFPSAPAYLNHDGNGYFYTIDSVSGLVLPEKSDDDIRDDIRDTCNFYLLRSIKLVELATTQREKIEVADDYLQSLVNREQMTDDYDSHDGLLPTYTQNYNSRLLLANVSKTLFCGFPAQGQYAYTNGRYLVISPDLDYSGQKVRDKIVEDHGTLSLRQYVYINQGSKIIILQSPVGTYGDNSSSYDSVSLPLLTYYFYPNAYAYRTVITRILPDGGDEEVLYNQALTIHDFLNGAYYFGGFDAPAVAEGGTPPVPTTDNVIAVTNKLYTSEVNNPFFFPVEYIVTIGTGTVLGIATAARALSQGQFGSFPLYAFCDDGVWALSVSEAGAFSAVQPITRDVAINSAAITQLDSSVLFCTDRGVMRISGSETECMSSALDGDSYLAVSALPHYEQLLSLAGLAEVQEDDIREILTTCHVVYDYVNQRIYICSSEKNMAFVLAGKSQAWGQAAVDIIAPVNSYPMAYATDSGYRFVDFSHPDTSVARCCFLVSRPLKLGAADTMKTVTALVQRGFFARGHIQQALFGSRDLARWHLIKSSTTHELRCFSGSPYKYFRIAVLAQMDEGESLFGATITAQGRMTNKIR